MIRGDWTPLWAADASTATALGAQQVRCLEMLKNKPMTRSELNDAGIGTAVLDTLMRTWPPLVGVEDGKHVLAAPGQLRALRQVLAAVRAGNEPGPPSLRYRGAAIDHLLNCGAIGYELGSGRYYPIDPPWDYRHAQEVRKRSDYPQPAVPGEPA